MSRKIFYLVLLGLPINLHRSFGGLAAYLNTYLVPKIYFTDILLLLLLLAWFWEKPFVPIFEEIKKRRFTFLFLGLFLFSLLSSAFLSGDPGRSFYHWLRLCLYVSFFVYLAVNINLAKDLYQIARFLAITLAGQSVLAMIQFYRQRFLTGFLPFGEPAYFAGGFDSPQVNLWGSLKLRAFGSFPHANVLGGFLSLGLIWLLVFVSLSYRDLNLKGRLFYLTTLVAGCLALVFSFSQAAWGALVLGLFSHLFVRSRFLKGWFRMGFGFLSLTLLLIFINFLPLDRPNNRRGDLLKVSQKIIWQHPWWGVGLGNFTQASTYVWREPVHNFWVLLLAEGGVLSAVFWLIFVGDILRHRWLRPSKNKSLLLISLAQIFFLSLFDHYLWTTQPGGLLLWLVLGLSF